MEADVLFSMNLPHLLRRTACAHPPDALLMLSHQVVRNKSAPNWPLLCLRLSRRYSARKTAAVALRLLKLWSWPMQLLNWFVKIKRIASPQIFKRERVKEWLGWITTSLSSTKKTWSVPRSRWVNPRPLMIYGIAWTKVAPALTDPCFHMLQPEFPHVWRPQRNDLRYHWKRWIAQ